MSGLLGLRSAGAAHLHLDGAQVEAEARLGRHTTATVALVEDAARPGTAAVALGVGRAALTGSPIHGGYGFTTDFPFERALRDATVLQLLHGTPALQRIQIARFLA